MGTSGTSKLGAFRRTTFPRVFHIHISVCPTKKLVASYILHNKSTLENNTLEQGRLKSMAIFVRRLLHQWLCYIKSDQVASYIAHRKPYQLNSQPRAKYFCARDSDYFCFGDYQLNSQLSCIVMQLHGSLGTIFHVIFHNIMIPCNISILVHPNFRQTAMPISQKYIASRLTREALQVIK